jgi:DNA-binding transcriptional ArsR family regulator
MGPVERAIRTRFPIRQADLETLSQRAPFALTWDEKGILVYLGKQRTPSRLSWSCLEGVPGHLRGQGWMLAGGMNRVTGEPGTLDEHLKKCVKVNTSRWVVRVLRDAGVVEARIDPVEVRLASKFEALTTRDARS